MIENPKPLESVSVLFIFKEKIFAVQRQPYLVAFPGYQAFPGGKIDKNESSVPFKTKILSDHDPRKMRAVCREVIEELGYDIEKGILRDEVISISEIAEAVAPDFTAGAAE